MLIAQFTYTACNQPGPYDNAPGWKVKEVAPVGVSRELIEESVRSFGSFKSPKIPSLATMAEIEELPRRLRLVTQGSGISSLSHIAAAGLDATSRDAFFAHALLVDAESPVPLNPAVVAAPRSQIPRPADLWAAAGWLTPYGVEAIEAATLRSLPAISELSPLDPDMRDDFDSLHPGQRAFVFAAVELSVTENRTLVVAGSPVETAMWVSLVTHLMLPSAAWAFEFSTYERADSLLPMLDGNTRVIGIAAADPVTARSGFGDRISLLESGDVPELVGDTFRLPDGSSLSRGPWGRLAEQVCVHGHEDEIRHIIDELANEVGVPKGMGNGSVAGPDSSAPRVSALWGLPAAVLLSAGHADMELDDTELDDTGAGEMWPADLKVVAARLATQTFPLSAGLSEATGRRLIDAILNIQDDAVGVFESLLRAADRQAAADRGLVDHVFRGYVTALLRDRSRFTGTTTPWLPAGITPSPGTAGQLLAELNDLIGWIDNANRTVAARVLLATAALAEPLDWLSPPSLATFRRVVLDRAGPLLLSLLLAGVPLMPEGWPPVPNWLWRRHLEPALTRRMGTGRPGSMLVAEGTLELVEQIAGPLDTAAGRTHLANWGVFGWERAAATLLLADGRNGAADQELLRAAAFLREVRPDRPSWSDPTLLMRSWEQHFPTGVVGWETLVDLVDALRRSPYPAEFGVLVDAALVNMTPTVETAALARTFATRGPLDPRTALAVHAQFDRPIPVLPRAGLGARAGMTEPDRDELELLDRVLDGELSPALENPGLERLAWWILVRPARYLSGTTGRGDEIPRWLTVARTRPLAENLRPAYVEAATRLVDRIRQHNEIQAAGELSIEWVVRATMADLYLGRDPAISFFGPQPDDPGQWFEPCRALLQLVTHSSDKARIWLRAMKQRAEETHYTNGFSRKVGPEEFSAACSRRAARIVDAARTTAVRKRTIG